MNPKVKEDNSVTNGAPSISHLKDKTEADGSEGGGSRPVTVPCIPPIIPPKWRDSL